MAEIDLLRSRLARQGLVSSSFANPADVVSWLTAVQCQDYLGSLWAIGQRVSVAARAPTEADVERAIAERAIVRTWPMRGTLHFVAAEDVRWMLPLLTPRIVLRCAGRNRELGIDASVLRKSRACLQKALGGGRTLTRPQAYRALELAGVATTAQRGLQVLIQLAMEGVICFGPRVGRQPAFVLLEDWIPARREDGDVDRDEALGRLAVRYVSGHGPATTLDFAWWSGLSLTDARRGLDVGRRALTEERVGEATYWMAPTPARKPSPRAVCHLLPAFDEYTVAYRDRSAFLDAAHAARAGNGISSPVVLVGGRIAGTWRRAIARGRVVVSAQLFSGADAGVPRALERAAERYGAFLALPVSIEVSRLG